MRRFGLLLLAVGCSGDLGDTASPAATSSTGACGATLLPAVPRTADDLVAEHTCGDEAAIAWYLDNLQVVDLQGPIVPSARTSRDDVWRVAVTPIAGGAQAGDPVSAKVTVENTPPVLLSLGLTEAPDATTDVEVRVTTTDDDDDNVALVVTWRLDGEEVITSSAIAFPAGLAVRGQQVEAEVAPFDGTDSGTAVTAAVTIGNAPPELASAELGVAEATTADTLTVTTAGWFDADGDPEGYRYAWYVGGAVAGGQTGASLSLAGADVGSAVYCEVTPTDGTDAGQPVNTPVAMVVP